MDDEKLFQSPRLRSGDINAAFKNPKVDAIIATIGGSDSVRILKHLDIETIKSNPILFIDLPDSTNITATLNLAGLVTFNGPSVMAGFAPLHKTSIVITKAIYVAFLQPTQIHNCYLHLTYIAKVIPIGKIVRTQECAPNY
ncbi:LD-carboxypeptidase [Pseudoalteromonas caenipelagi]|uniref:LD-carboxypeptidase n=1 Tax=Pseudoalteromonas caenipelagi TaxID=2726988 RepID=UPI001FE45484|nr:LD-carboxypeptidase [Pseudoalteromonas caenipelagi]